MIAASARPTLAGDGAALTAWRRGRYSPDWLVVYLTCTVAATLTKPTGGVTGVEVWGYKDGLWWLHSFLNGGADIPLVLGSVGGFAALIRFGGIFDRVAVAGAASAGTASAAVEPIGTLLE